MSKTEEKLEEENYLLNQELQDLKSKYQNLQKEHKVWEQINSNNESPLEKQFESQNQYYKQQVVSLANQKQRAQNSIQELRQKVDDLKYRNKQLKELNEKQAHLHQKQIQFLTQCGTRVLQVIPKQKSDMRDNSEAAKGPSPRVQSDLEIQDLKSECVHLGRCLKELNQELERERTKNNKSQAKLEKCSRIAQQMEEYYTSELESRDQVISAMEEELKNIGRLYQNEGNSKFLSSLGNSLFRNSTKLHSKVSEDQNSLRCSSIVSECHKDGLFGSEDRFQKAIDSYSKAVEGYEKTIEQLRESSDRQISKYQDKVKYLILKVESLEEELVRVNSFKNSAFEGEMGGRQENALRQRYHNSFESDSFSGLTAVSHGLKMGGGSTGKGTNIRGQPKSRKSTLVEVGLNTPEKGFLDKNSRKSQYSYF